MKTILQFNRSQKGGYALLMAMGFMAIGTLVLTSSLNWASQNAISTDRNNDYFATIAAAEAATEQVYSHLASDFYKANNINTAKMNEYSRLIPISSHADYWTNFQFAAPKSSPSANPNGFINRTYINQQGPPKFVALDSRFRGLGGMATTYRIISNTKSERNNINVGVGQDIQTSRIPIFQFAIFYSMDLEINPGPTMVVDGRVHCNKTIYTRPGTSLTFLGDVTAAEGIVNGRKPGDPLLPGDGTVQFNGGYDSSAMSINLPIGTNNSPDAVHAVLEIPPFGESPNSPMGRQRFYNKTDMILIISNNAVMARSGVAINNAGTQISTSDWSAFLKTNITFFNNRESKNIKAVEIDISKLRVWTKTNNTLRPALGNKDVSSIYIADMRTQSATTESGIRLVNGETLPSRGLTVATPNPLYIQGDYNVSKDGITFTRGSTNDTSNTLPASVAADAINILSTAWNDANSALPLLLRRANDTTVNAAILGGIVPTENGFYSGGVENFPRFLEDWGSKILTYNGSMVVMFRSKIATAPWIGTGGSVDVYNPPNRNWNFDKNFLLPDKLPPATPELLKVLRSRWAVLQPNTTEF